MNIRSDSRSHTFAVVLEVRPDPAAVIDQRPFRGEVRGGSVGESPVIQVEQLAVVSGLLRGAPIEERSAEEIVLGLAGQSASRLARDLQLFVRVIMQPRVLRDSVLVHADSGQLEVPLELAGLFP